MHCPSREAQLWLPEQSLSSRQGSSLAALSTDTLRPSGSCCDSLCTHRLLEQAPPVAPQSSFSVQVKGTPGNTCGKYCRPTPISAVSAEAMKACTASCTASHLVWLPAASCTGS